MIEKWQNDFLFISVFSSLTSSFGVVIWGRWLQKIFVKLVEKLSQTNYLQGMLD